MKKIFQTDTTDKTGNCHPCSLATLFGFPLEEIPNFVTTKDWRKTYYDFMRSKNIGVLLIPITSPETLELFLKLNPEIMAGCLLAVRSFKHENKGHCVVGRIADGKIEIVHDPNPENADKKTKDYEIWTIDFFFQILPDSTPNPCEMNFVKNKTKHDAALFFQDDTKDYFRRHFPDEYEEIIKCNQ